MEWCLIKHRDNFKQPVHDQGSGAADTIEDVTYSPPSSHPHPRKRKSYGNNESISLTHTQKLSSKAANKNLILIAIH
jgi:hypothetical protein